MKFLTTAAFLVLNSAVVNAFSASPSFARHAIHVRSVSTLFNSPETFYRAVECAENGLCEVDELLSLADDLDQLNECVYEEGEGACEKEIQDRHDVAEILRMRSELRLRTEYLKNANLFVDDVHREQHLQETKSYVESFNNGQEGLGLGLW
mmetsp:Transcript_34261/g.50372  ORF Transcript_34261/g.50372 Transcript_34261/m.50372 type:complete len:151 (-) Transcript_34261:253-705(-)|eukprot:CAMPEP_0195517764 /NCGR_PEP_ID=MMETSP0794_2-20130614/11629_1 /TAXON_ID=515487 /ORGANISM="Stephanopyxis turris, Strain CCMP 815" /LENGTH=150 /DNA_ID=CAMNT_0040646635 /DNA_START=153 /DNA_END=605 /DNA_ORIENTATION=+